MEKKVIRALVVEDNYMDLELLRVKLSGSKNYNFKISGAKSLLEAFAALGQDSYEVILLDLSLPDSSGIDTYVKIREKAEKTPVIILTADNDAVLAEQAAQKGVQDYFIKGNYSGDALERSIVYSVERKKHEQLLRESEEKYKNIFNYAEVGIFRSKIDGSAMLDFNKRMENILEYTRQELLDLPAHRMWVDEGMREQMFGELKKNSVLNDYEMNITVKNGKIKTVLVSMRAFEKEGYLEGAISDITKLKQAQAALVESEDHFRSAFEQAAVGMAFSGLDGRFIRVNRRFCGIIGYTKQEMAEFTFKDITSPDEIEDDLNGVKLLIEGGLNAYRTRKKYIKKDASTVWADVTVALTRDAGGRPGYFVAVIEDVTVLKENEERWINFTEAAGEHLMLWDRDLNLTAVNAAAQAEYESRTGKKMMPGQPVTELLRDIKSTGRYEMFRKVIRTGEPLNINEYEINTDGHETKYFSLKAFRAGSGMGLIRSDISELKKSEIQLKKSFEKLKEVDRLKSSFISIISHELRTPLTIIKGFTSFLVRQSAGPLNDAQKNFASTIDLNITRLERIINDMVDTSRIESGIFSIQKAPVDLAGILEEAMDGMDHIAGAYGIKLTRDMKIRSAPVEADKGRLLQAVYNILNNGIRFSKKGGTIGIELKHAVPGEMPEKIRNRLAKGRAYYILSIADAGLGLEEKNKEKIFDRFFQAENANNRKHQGAGLGLSIAKNVVEMHGGLIWAESGGLGLGTKICMILPEKD